MNGVPSSVSINNTPQLHLNSYQKSQNSKYTYDPQTTMSTKYDTSTTADELVKDFASEIKNKPILTLGGLGAAFVESIAKGQPSHLIITGRTVEKVQRQRYHYYPKSHRQSSNS